MSTRVLFVGHSAALSGAELFLAGMLERAREVDPVVLLLEDGPLVPHLRERGIAVDVCPRPGAPGSSGRVVPGGTNPRTLPRFARRLHTTIRTSGAAVVHTNSAKAHVLVPPVAGLVGTPVAMHVHERIVPDTYGRTNRSLLHLAAAAARTVLVASETTRATLRPRERARAHVVPCPVEVHPVPARPRAGVGRMSVALVGRVSPWKGQHEAIRALDRTRAGSGPTPRIDLHLYGAPLFDRDRAYAEEARALVDRLGLTDRVHWHGHVADVTAAMQSHDLVLHASTRPEPFGQVLLEGMAAGLPVLAADDGGPRELMVHGRSGWLYRLGDVEAMAQGLVTLAADPALRDRLAAAAHLRAADFSYERVLPRWEQVLVDTARR